MIIDLDDYERVSQYHWGICKAQNYECDSYRILYVSNNTVGLLHRFIVNAPKGKFVDHEDGDTFNNRKSNLRICTHYQNAKNRKRSSINKSGHKGVCLVQYPSGTQKWKAYACHKNKITNLGFFDDILDAIKAREDFENTYYQDFNREDIDYELIEQNKKLIS